jgi:NADPH:quinone reductase-like Zn-dependent oxidoreductase
MDTMRAVQFDAFGGPEVLEVRTVPRPVPGRGEVLVRVLASTVNGHDLLARSGALRMLTGRRFPMGVGIDFAGTVEGFGDSGDPRESGERGAPGAGAGLAVGTPVWGSLRALTRHVTGSLAEYVAVGVDRVAPMPPGLTPAEAASLVVPGPTAVRALRRSAGLASGERVLVRGAGGGVGLAVAQLAAATGAVVTTLSAERDFERLRSYGVTSTLDYRTHTCDDLVRFDVVVDTVGRQLRAYRRMLAPGGRMVAVAWPGTPAEFASVVGSTVFGTRRMRVFSDDARRKHLLEVADLVATGTLRPVLGPRFPLEAAAQAHRSLTEGGTTGKRVVDLT